MNAPYDDLIRLFDEKKVSILDSDNICWKLIDGNWVGKRSVWTFDNRACWLEDTERLNVKTWWCGEDADYDEILTITKR